jgi:hypothetical protein
MTIFSPFGICFATNSHDEPCILHFYFFGQSTCVFNDTRNLEEILWSFKSLINLIFTSHSFSKA